jgi:hypothetical protein
MVYRPIRRRGLEQKATPSILLSIERGDNPQAWRAGVPFRLGAALVHCLEPLAPDLRGGKGGRNPGLG